MVNTDCPVCSAEGADLEACKGEEPAPLEPVTCTCEAKCTEGVINSGCPVCSTDGADLEACKGVEATQCTCKTKCIEETISDCPVCSIDWTACKGAEEVPNPVCSCEIACTEDNINLDCVACAAEDADLSECVGQSIAPLNGIPTEVALCTYVSKNGKTQSNKPVTLKEAVEALNSAGGGTITVIQSGRAGANDIPIRSEIQIIAQESNPVTVTTEPMEYDGDEVDVETLFLLDMAVTGAVSQKLTLGAEGMTDGLLTFDGAEQENTSIVKTSHFLAPSTNTKIPLELNDGVVLTGCTAGAIGSTYKHHINFVMHGGKITGNSGESTVEVAVFTMDGGEISHNTSEDYTIYDSDVTNDVSFGPTIIEGNAKICNNTAGKCAGIYSESDVYMRGDSLITDCVVKDGRYADDCAGAVVTSDNLTMGGNAKIINCSSDTNAGAVNVIFDFPSTTTEGQHGTFTMEDNALIDNCISTDNGGVGGALVDAYMTMRDQAKITNCRAEYGGYQTETGGASVRYDVYMQGNAEVSSCESENIGGISVGRDLYMQDSSTVANCNGEETVGGVSAGERIEMSGEAEITECSSTEGTGGAIALEQVIMSGQAQIFDCDGNIGGVTVVVRNENAPEVQLSMSGEAQITECTGSQVGGAIILGTTRLDETSAIRRCTSTSNDKTLLAGGLVSFGNITLGQNAEISECTGPTGGLACMLEITFSNNDAEVAQANINGTIRDNHGTVGGGIAVSVGAHLNINKTANITGNTASQAGGGIAVFNGMSTNAAEADREKYRVKLILNGGTITGNTAPLGGGVFVAGAEEAAEIGGANENETPDYGAVELKGGTITGNFAKNPKEDGPATEFHGGGMFLGWDVMTMASGRIVISGNSDSSGHVSNLYLRKDPNYTVVDPNADELDTLKNFITEKVEVLYQTEILPNLQEDLQGYNDDQLKQEMVLLGLVSADSTATREELEEILFDFYHKLIGSQIVLNETYLSSIIAEYKKTYAYIPSLDEFMTLMMPFVKNVLAIQYRQIVWGATQEKLDELAVQLELISDGESYTGTKEELYEALVQYIENNPDIVASYESVIQELYKEVWNIDSSTSTGGNGIQDARLHVIGSLEGSKIEVTAEGAQNGRTLAIGHNSYSITDTDWDTFITNDDGYNIIRHPDNKNQLILYKDSADDCKVTVTYRVVNGAWDDGTTEDKTEVVSLQQNGVPSPDGSGKLQSIPAVGNKPNDGYDVGGWDFDPKSAVITKNGGVFCYTYTPIEKINVSYQWVSADNPSDVAPPDSQQIERGNPYTASVQGETDEEFTFDGWYLDKACTEKFVDGTTLTENTILYGQWIRQEGEPEDGGGAHHPEANPKPEPEEPEKIPEEDVPMAETPWLNTDDHYAYIVGYPEDYVTGEPTEDESRWPVKPQANITRAEVATIFFRLLTDEARDQFWSTSNNFTDVAADAWYNNAISTMVNAGIIQGYEDGTFRPNNNITRAEFAAIASRFMSSGYDVEEDLFTDIANHWARKNINDAAMTQWIHGYPDGTFLPDKAITRAEAVTLVNNVLQRKPDADHMLDSMIKWPDNIDTSAWYYEAIQEATNSHDYDLFEGAEYETWTALQENRDWAALEKDWLNAHRTGGEVM